MYRTHTCGELRKKDQNQKVKLVGWINKIRNFGELIFIDLRDRYGVTQLVIDLQKMPDKNLLKSLKNEYIIQAQGVVKLREQINKNLETGEIEVIVNRIEIISQAENLPFEIETKDEIKDENLLLKYRYLSLRKRQLQENLIFRAEMIKYIHNYLDNLGYLEINTPILTVSSPEGARDFLVPSRLHKGKFYALPQAPQQYKQLLMVAGFDKYYQIAPCMRDEDPRADRSPGEFYQLDVEVSFMNQEEFFQEMEPLLIGLTEDLAKKQVWKKPFPRFAYQEIMNKYGSDRPDLRFDLQLQDITEWANRTEFRVFQQADIVKMLFVPDDNNVLSRKIIEQDLEVEAKKAQAKGLAWLKYQNNEFSGSISKFFKPEELEIIKPKQNGWLFFVADKWLIACTALGRVRERLGDLLNLKDENVIAWAWVVDFPMFEYNEQEGKIDFGHNPFSMPQSGLDVLEKTDPLNILAYQYDIIANGLEISSGAVRNTDSEIMYKVFEIAGYDKSVVEKKFGHMLKAFKYGVPPHCGFAPGIERLVMLLRNEKSIRSVVAFPKNKKAEEPMMGSPAEVSEEQLKELGIKIEKE